MKTIDIESDSKLESSERVEADQEEDFSYVQSLIDNAKDGDSIILKNKTYKGNGTPISINKNLNLYGYQYESNINTILDADFKSNIFSINENVHINIYGLSLINGKNYNGGAIYNQGTLKIYKSNFKLNDGEWGGCIYNGKDLEAYDSTFDKNTAFEAGAIYNAANLKIENCNFTSQKVRHKAGVIFSSRNLIINNSIFRLTSGSDEGGAIFTNGGSITIDSSKFELNKALSYGGSIDNSGTMTIKNCEFISNSAYGAGAIDNGGELTIINSTFINNKSTVNGGAIDSNKHLNILGSVFENNTAKGNGGAILARGKTTLSHSSIINNIDSQGYGIYSYEDNISLDNNWWGSNNPKFERILNIEISNDFRWVLMNFTNITPLMQSSESELIFTFNQTTDKNKNQYSLKNSSKMPYILGSFVLEGENGKKIFKVNATNGKLLKTIYIRLDKTITAIFNEESISLDILEKTDEHNETDNETDDDTYEDLDYGDVDKNTTPNQSNKSDDSINRNNASNDFSKQETFNLDKFKNKDFTKSIQKSTNPKLDNSNTNSSNEEIYDEGINEKSESDDLNKYQNYLIPIAILILALFIIFAAKRKKDNNE